MAFIGRGINTVRTVGNQTAYGNKTFANVLLHNASLLAHSDNEGGQIDFAAGSNSLPMMTSAYIDIFNHVMRFVCQGGSLGTRVPFQIDFNTNTCVGVNGWTMALIAAAGSNYILFNNGFRVCWGETSGGTAGKPTNFAIQFTQRPMVCNMPLGYNNNESKGVSVSNITTTNAILNNSGGWSNGYIAVGY